jgi:dTDP-4-dehydrorhamnose reductase
LAQKIAEVIRAGGRGMFHITNQGRCSWYEYAGQIFDYLGLEPDFAPTTTEAYGAKAARPAYSVLRNGKLETLGIEPMAQWQDALRRYLKEKGHV